MHVPALHLAHLRAVRRTTRRVCRTVALRTHTPLTRLNPAPHAWATCVTRPWGTSSFSTGMACAEVVSVSAKTSAINLIIISSIQSSRNKTCPVTAALRVRARVWRLHRLTYIQKTERSHDIDQSTLAASNPANPVLNPLPVDPEISSRMDAAARFHWMHL
jgi:hypothetical protein